MKIISFFNHKGGVSKTTTTYHLGWKLMQKGKKVLLVDADSQCNLSLTAIGDDSYEQFLLNEPDNNIKSCLDIAFQSRPQLIPIPNCVKVKGHDDLLLLPGSFDITEFEVQLGISFQLSNSFSTMNSLPGSFYYLIKETAQKFDVDYVLVDMNPSLSAINQDLISISDYFILPTSPDSFSHMAIKSLSRILPQWENWAVQARIAFSNTSNTTYPLPDVKPKFLGYTVNDYNIRNGKATAAFESIILKTKSLVEGDFYNSLENVQMVIDKSMYDNNDLCLASISNFQHLMPKYQDYGIPVFALSKEQIGTTGTILDGHLEKQDLFNNIYDSFAEKIIKLTSL